MVQSIWSQIMELPYPLCYHEAQKKLKGTIIEADGTLYHVDEVFENGLGAIDEEGNLLMLKPKAIKAFLPKSGVYYVDGEHIVIERIPKKQWKKSFSFDFYSVNIGIGLKHLKEIHEKKIKPQDFYIKENTVMYWKNKIGLYQKETGTVLLSSGTFYQELLDLQKENTEWKNKKIVLMPSLTTKNLKSIKALKVLVKQLTPTNW